MRLGGLAWWHHRHTFTGWRLFILVTVTTVFINEYLVYMIQSYRWPAMPESKSFDDINKQVLLLVADPQLQGYQDEPGFPWGTLWRWDIDRYVSRTFSMAYSYSRPNIVLYLGDLMDEGSKATTGEYQQTLHRFHSAFATARHAKKIYIPGDNDIGGEGRDFKTARKMARFEKHFGNISALVKFGFIDYTMLNIPTHSLPPESIDAAEALKRRRTSPISVMLNHETLISSPKHFVFPVLKRLRPNIVISAHWHKATVYLCDDCMKDNEFSWNVVRQDVTFVNTFLNIDLTDPDSLVEIAVPTCSYRMGTGDIGYGVVIIEADRSVQYTVLWLPRRYTMLHSYLVVFGVCLSVYLVNYCLNRGRQQRR